MSFDQAQAKQLHTQLQLEHHPHEDFSTGTTQSPRQSAVSASSTVAVARARSRRWVSSLLGVSNAPHQDEQHLAVPSTIGKRIRADSSPSYSTISLIGEQQGKRKIGNVRSPHLRPVSALVFSTGKDAFAQAPSAVQPALVAPEVPPKDIDEEDASRLSTALLGPDELEAQVETQIRQESSSGLMNKEETAVLTMLDQISGIDAATPLHFVASPQSQPSGRPVSSANATPRPAHARAAIIGAPPCSAQLTASGTTSSGDTETSSNATSSSASSLFSPALKPATQLSGQRACHPRASSGSGFFFPNPLNAKMDTNALDLPSPGQVTALTTPGLPSSPAGSSMKSSHGLPMNWPRAKGMYGLAIRNESSQDDGPDDPLAARLRPSTRRHATQYTNATSIESQSPEWSSEDQHKTDENQPLEEIDSVVSAAAPAESSAISSIFRAAHAHYAPAGLRAYTSAPPSPTKSAKEFPSSVSAAQRSAVASSLQPSPGKTRELIDFFDNGRASPALPSSPQRSARSVLLSRSPSRVKAQPWSMAMGRPDVSICRHNRSALSASKSFTGSAVSILRRTEYGNLPLDNTGALALLPTPASNPLMTGSLKFLDRNSTATVDPDGQMKRWVPASVCLLQEAIAVSWLPIGGGRENVAIHLHVAKDVRSLASAEVVGAETSYPFEVVFADGVEMLAASGPLDRIRWVTAIDGVLRQRKASMRTASHVLQPAADLPGSQFPTSISEPLLRPVTTAPVSVQEDHSIQSIPPNLKRSASPALKRIASSLFHHDDFVSAPSQAGSVRSARSRLWAHGRSFSELAPSESASQIEAKEWHSAVTLNPQMSPQKRPLPEPETGTTLMNVPICPQPQTAQAPRPAFVALTESIASVNMEAEVRARRRQLNSSLNPQFPESAATGFYTAEKELPSLPKAKRAHFGGQLPDAEHVRTQAEHEAFPGAWAPSAMHAMPQKANLNEVSQRQEQRHPDVSRYLADLNAWLDKDLAKREENWQDVSASIERLNRDIAALKEGTSAPLVSKDRKMDRSNKLLQTKDLTEGKEEADQDDQLQKKNPPGRTESAKLMFGHGGQWTNAPWQEHSSAAVTENEGAAKPDSKDRALQPTQARVIGQKLSISKEVATSTGDSKAPLEDSEAGTSPEKGCETAKGPATKHVKSSESHTDPKMPAVAKRETEAKDTAANSGVNAKSAASLAAMATALEAIMSDMVKKKEEKARRREEKASAYAAVQRQAQETREQEKRALLNAVVSQLADFQDRNLTEQAHKARQMDPKSAIEALVASLNAAKQSEADALATADKAIKDMTAELLRKSGEQHVKLVAAVNSAASEMLHHHVASHAEELKKVLGRDVQRMFEEVGRIRETKRALEHEIGELFALKAKYFGSSVFKAAPAGAKSLPAPTLGFGKHLAAPASGHATPAAPKPAAVAAAWASRNTPSPSKATAPPAGSPNAKAKAPATASRNMGPRPYSYHW
ncbi:hypothetical protein K437DRAFT_263287 [Tilletiaria anomala UBC 951]|uniref:PH domain-containing protein n=1 Tax=Tilletiaria anomala (strain ATCC 24038 / CBS 436.72 / UBC 951) TaxID=1037660 RepID=A0A066VR81_TILAU|nr:uncharacterized protein K437DRAFT_263287 [Tilletiaria anomala UBC 951]KDN44252.1 hypothetical protein K437DRAFT_263287 [Tilletiaria anomala UBC 951]